MSSNSTASDDKLKIGISVWLSFCLFVCVWFLSRFIRGRRQLRHNLHVIEDGLRRMQDEMEKRQRENSITYGEGFDNLTEMLKKHGGQFSTEEAKTEEEKDSDISKKQRLVEDGGDEEKPEVAVQDKKND